MMYSTRVLVCVTLVVVARSDNTVERAKKQGKAKQSNTRMCMKNAADRKVYPNPFICAGGGSLLQEALEGEDSKRAV